MWRLITQESFSVDDWPVAYFLSFSLSHVRPFTIFGEKPTDEPIGMLVHASFQGPIRTGKIDLRLQILRDAYLFTEFKTLVIGESVHSGFIRLQATDKGLPKGHRCFIPPARES